MHGSIRPLDSRGVKPYRLSQHTGDIALSIREGVGPQGGCTMSKPLSAVDCVSPALAQTKKQLFAPFQSRRWLRLAVVCILTGEFAGGGGGGGGNFHFPDRKSTRLNSSHAN